MATTYGDIRKQTLKLLDEYSSRGAVVTSVSKIGDIKLKIQSLANATLYDLATSTAKRPAVFYIAHSPIKNALGEDTSSIKQHLPGTDYSITLTGAKAAYFEATGPSTVVIEESANSGQSYSTIETISIPASVTSLTAYRRLISPASDDNLVRLRFTGDYLYLFRNFALYQYTFPSEDDVQQHRPWFCYDLPDDFLEINYVEAEKDTRQYVPYVNHRLRPDNKICFNRFDAPLQLIMHYWRRPNLLTFTGNDETDDAQTIDLTDDAAIIMPYNIAGEILKSEKQITEGAFLLNQYEAKKAALVTNTSNYLASVLNIYGW